MAHQLKYVLQYYALGANTYPYYQWLIYQDDGSFDDADGPIYLEAEGNEPVSWEMFESSGPIKPTSALLNLVNRKYGQNEARELDVTAFPGRCVTGDGSGDIWVGTDEHILYYANGVDLPVVNQRTWSPGIRDLESGATGKLIAVGMAGGILNTTDTGGTWSFRADWSGAEEHDYFTVAYSRGSSTLLALAGSNNNTGLAVLGKSTDSGDTWADMDAKVSLSTIKSIAFSDADTLWLVFSDETLWKITTWSGTPSSASQISGISKVSKVDFCDASNGLAIGNAASDGKSFITSDGGTTWTQRNIPISGDIGGLHYYATDLIVIIGQTTNNNIEFSYDGAISWNQISNEGDISGNVPSSANPVFYDGTAERAYFLTNDGTPNCEYNLAYITDLTEFKEVDFAEYMVKLQRSTTAHQDGGGSQALMWNQAIIDSEYGYTEDWATPIHGITQIRATDGYNIWKSLEYRTGAGALQTGRKKITAILAEAFELIYSGFGTTDYFETYCTYLNDNLGSDFSVVPSDATNPFVVGFVDAEYFLHERYKPYTWWEVITAILKSYDCQLSNPLFFIVGSPQIIANDRFYNAFDNDNIARLRYTTSAAYNAAPSSVYVRDLNNTEGIFQGLYQVREKPYQYVEAVIKNARPKMVIERGMFRTEDWATSSSLLQWTASVSPTTTIAQLAVSGANVYSDFAVEVTVTSPDLATAGNFNNTVPVQISPKTSDSLYLRFQYKCDVTSTASGENIQDNPRFYFKLQLGDEYLYDGSTNKPELRSPLDNFSWTTTESWITIDVAGDNMDAVTEFNLKLGDLPVDAGDGLTIYFSECDYGDYSAGSDTLSIHEVIIFKKEAIIEYEDVRITGENTAISNGKRLDLGELHFYDLPKIDFRNTGSQVLPSLVFDVNADYNVGTVRIELDETSREYHQGGTYNLGTRTWVNLTDLQKLLYNDSNNYIITIAGDILTIVAIEALTIYDMDASAITSNPGAWAFNSGPTDATPATVDLAWVNPASISDDATPTTMADYTWHAVTQETAGTEDTSFHKLRLERELSRRGKQSQFLQGTYITKAEDTDQFGGMMGLLPSGETNYKPVSIRANTRMGEQEIVMEKVHDQSVTFVGEEVYEEPEQL